MLGALWWLLPASSRLGTELGFVEALLFVVAAVVMELLPIRVADGRAVPTSLAVIGAAAMLGVSPPGLGLLAAAGYLGAVSLRRDRVVLATLLRRAVRGWVLAGMAVVGGALGPEIWT